MTPTEILFDLNGLNYIIENNGSKGYGDSYANTMRYWHLTNFRYKRKINIDGIDVMQTRSGMEDLHNKFVVDTKFNLAKAPGYLLPPEWGDPVKDFSADQQDPGVMCLGSYNDELDFDDVISRIRSNQEKRWWFYQNGDLPRSYTSNIFRRSMREEITPTLDMGIWGTVYSRCGKLPFWDAGTHTLEWNDLDEVSDVLNLVHFFIQCEETLHSRHSWKAMEYFSKNCSKSFGSYSQHEAVKFDDKGNPIEYGLGFGNNIMGAIAWYFRKHNTGFVELYRPIIEQFFNPARFQ